MTILYPRWPSRQGQYKRSPQIVSSHAKDPNEQHHREVRESHTANRVDRSKEARTQKLSADNDQRRKEEAPEDAGKHEAQVENREIARRGARNDGRHRPTANPDPEPDRQRIRQ